MQKHFLASPSEVGALTEGLARRIVSLLPAFPSSLRRIFLNSSLSALCFEEEPASISWCMRTQRKILVSGEPLLRGGYFELFSANAHTVVSLRLRSCTFSIWSGPNKTIEVLLLIVYFSVQQGQWSWTVGAGHPTLYSERSRFGLNWERSY